MSIGAGGILGAALMLGLALGTPAALAQASPQGAWTDPPARDAAPSGSAASPAAPVKEPAPAAAISSRPAESAAASRSSETKRSETASEADTPARVRQAAKPLRRQVREVRRAQVVVEAPRARVAAPRLVERRGARPMAGRVVTRAYTPRTFAAAPPYPYAPLPVGRVVGPVDGERNPIFADGDDRTRRIAAAQAAGYLVVRARSVQYPDGRMVRRYRPYDEDDGLD